LRKSEADEVDKPAANSQPSLRAHDEPTLEVFAQSKTAALIATDALKRLPFETSVASADAFKRILLARGGHIDRRA